ncbi:MAG: sugar porter family MFS transporter, partial [Pseudomonadota bacterium]
MIVYVAAAVAALGAVLFGYNTAVIAGALLHIDDDVGLTGGKPMSPILEGLVVSSVLLGAVIGAALGGWIGDRFGRRRTLMLAGAVFVLGGLGAMLAPSVAVLIATRILTGCAIGAASLMVPMYVAEISPARLRGTLVAGNQLGVVVGILIAYIINYALADSSDWRAMFGIAIVPALLLVAGMGLMPESPRWLVARDQPKDARRVLARLRGSEEVDHELADIRHSLGQKSEGFGALIAPAVRPVLMIGVVLAILQQVTGINTVYYYAPTIVEDAGLLNDESLLFATVGLGVVTVLATMVSMWLVDRAGRRPLLLVSLVGMAVTLAALALVFGQSSLPHVASGRIAVAAMMLYVIFFSIGLGPVFWLLIAEIYPLNVRAPAMSIATVINWGSNMIVAALFLTLIAMLGRA